jgi:hypothetical protein
VGGSASKASRVGVHRNKVVQIKDQFTVLHVEGAESGRVMAIALHPFIMGQPHRIAALARALAFIDEFPGVWKATGSEIAPLYGVRCACLIEGRRSHAAGAFI